MHAAQSTEIVELSLFSARYEAARLGCPVVNAEHLLLGIIESDQALASRLFASPRSVDAIRRQVEQRYRPRRKVPAAHRDIPLSGACRRVLGYAGFEAEVLKDDSVTTGHLMLGLLRERGNFAHNLLRARGLDVPTVRHKLCTLRHTA